MNRRWSVLSALLATALLFCCMPGLLRRLLLDTGRTDDRLKPAVSRTMVVWVTSWLEEDRQLISRLCTDFEKQRPGLRIYLRRADASELTAPDAVLPDAVLYTTGDILAPEEVFLPMSVLEETGKSGGLQLGIPLWYRPMVLCVPKAWFQEEREQVQEADRADQAYFALATPVPEKPAVYTLADVPWRKWIESGSVVAQSGGGFSLMLLHCLPTLQEEIAALTPVLRKPQAGEAGICSLSACLEREKDAVCLPLSPPTGQQARYLSLCRESADAKAFVSFLRSVETQAAAANVHLMPMVEEAIEEDSWAARIAGGGEAFVPNAFQMDSAAMDQYCIENFQRFQDPVATLLGLR